MRDDMPKSAGYYHTRGATGALTVGARPISRGGAEDAKTLKARHLYSLPRRRAVLLARRAGALWEQSIYMPARPESHEAAWPDPMSKVIGVRQGLGAQSTARSSGDREKGLHVLLVSSLR